MRNVLNIDLRKIFVPEGRMRPVNGRVGRETARQHPEGATAAASARGSPQRR